MGKRYMYTNEDVYTNMYMVLHMHSLKVAIVK